MPHLVGWKGLSLGSGHSSGHNCLLPTLVASRTPHFLGFPPTFRAIPSKSPLLIPLPSTLSLAPFSSPFTLSPLVTMASLMALHTIPVLVTSKSLSLGFQAHLTPNQSPKLISGTITTSQKYACKSFLTLSPKPHTHSP